MDQEKLNEIIQLEKNFQQLTEEGHPYVVDNGYFLDAIFNVTAELKRLNAETTLSDQCQDNGIDDKLEVIGNLYRSLKDFQSLYNFCLKRQN